METSSSDRKLVFNGIDAATGSYLIPPKSVADVAAVARGERQNTGHIKDLFRRQAKKPSSYLVGYGYAPDKIDESGWGVIFARGADPKVAQALKPLLDLRRSQTYRYKEYSGEDAYQPGETNQSFLARHKMGPGMANPEVVPYYLLIVGDPVAIPFAFQFQLDVQYAVGRLWFDSLDEYASYAKSVVQAETGGRRRGRKAVLFGTQNVDDPATEMSATGLITPMAERLPAKLLRRGKPWEIESLVGATATKANLSRVLGGDRTPALLFTASHGMGFGPTDSRQANEQGALLCQDWPGPEQWRKAIPPEFYFGRKDVPDDASLSGMISFHFACFSAGTPERDDYVNALAGTPPQIAPRPFIASLPRRLLGHPAGGALAAVGHIERAWGCSIVWEQAGIQIDHFVGTMQALMEGKPIGFALEPINQRYADIGVKLNGDLAQATTSDEVLATDWTANNDARSYFLLGDPFVRLSLDDDNSYASASEPSARASIPSVESPAAVASQTVSPTELRSETPQGVTMAEGNDAQPDSVNKATREPPVVNDGGEAPSKAIRLPMNLDISISIGAEGDVQVNGVSIGDRPTGTATEGIGASRSVQPLADGAQTDFAVEIDQDYSNREGYDPEFIGSGAQAVPLPRLSESQLQDCATIDDDGARSNELKYHHFSLVHNAKRRLAFFTAVNIDGRSASSPKRERDRWYLDPRVDESEQVGDDFYGRPYDRGHLVRRLDPAWGRSAKIIKAANDDTFVRTNAAPQHSRFNQGKNLWAGLEDFLLEKAVDERKRLTVFTGPVFKKDDPEYKGVQIPLRFWKIAVIARPNNKLAVVAFVVTQEDLVRETVSFSSLDVARTFQVPVRTVEKLTGFDFGRLREFDVASVVNFAVGGSERPLSSFTDIVLPGLSSNPTPNNERAFGTTSTGAGVSFNTGSVEADSIAAGDLPPERVPGTEIDFHLLAYDEAGMERRRAARPDILPSDAVIRSLAQPSTPYTDVFVLSHGWLGDVPSAIDTYHNWIRAMAAQTADIAVARQRRPNFKPLIVGFHWPSLPWGDESFSAMQSFDVTGSLSNDTAIERLARQYEGQLGDTADEWNRIREPLRRVLRLATSASANGQSLPPTLAAAYRELDVATGLRSDGVNTEPGSDREPFDPDAVYADIKQDNARSNQPGSPSFGLSLPSRDDLLAPLRTLSFWKMKDRGRQVGEVAGSALLLRLQQAIANRDIRIHLVGHSFGCIVVSAAVAGPAADVGLQPVQSMTLLQGALSLWSYCSDIPYASGTPGYFNRLIASQRVRGAMVTSNSKFDTAVGKWYPRAAQMRRQVAFAASEFPKYGGIGTFGIQGPGCNVADIAMLGVDGDYRFTAGGIYNVNGDQYIREGGGFSGAHSDILKPEVAHMAWQAALA